jgi:hypothetical protein
MGVDVSLFPVDFGDDEEGYTSFSRLALERRRELWDDLGKVQSLPCSSLNGHVADSYGSATEDSYGTPLRYATAGNLKQLCLHRAVWQWSSNPGPPEALMVK